MSFCTNCGTKLEKDYRVCPKCGTQVDPEIIVEAQQGEDSNQQDEYSFQRKSRRKVQFEARQEAEGYLAAFENVKDTVTESAEKAIGAVKSFADKAVKQISEQGAASAAKNEDEYADDNKRQDEFGTESNSRGIEKENIKKASSRNRDTASNNELWSWLKQSSKRQMYCMDEPSRITQGEYVVKLQEKFDEYEVPVEIEERKIQWDRSGDFKTIKVIKPITDEVNPFSCFLNFDHVGNYTFVEEKVFITPPNLPKVPGKPVPYDERRRSSALGMVWIGVGICLSGLLFLSAPSYLSFMQGIGMVALLIGIIMALLGGSTLSELRQDLEYNNKCAEELMKWNKAWSDWQESIFLHSYQEDINGRLSRIFDAAFDCIKILNKELFSDKIGVEQEEKVNMNEIEEMVSRRKEEMR